MYFLQDPQRITAAEVDAVHGLQIAVGIDRAFAGLCSACPEGRYFLRQQGLQSGEGFDHQGCFHIILSIASLCGKRK